jgi:hypothetical protein
MIKKSWPCDYYCSLCLCMHETTDHLLTKCNYIEATWNLIAPKFQLRAYSVMGHLEGPLEWVWELLQVGSKSLKRTNLGIFFTFWWLIWKEHNRRVFENKELSSFHLSSLIVDEFNLQSFAASAWCCFGWGLLAASRVCCIPLPKTVVPASIFCYLLHDCHPPCYRF